MMKKLIIFSVLILSLTLSSCSSALSYDVDSKYKEMAAPLEQLFNGIIKGDSSSYTSAFEPDYIENVKGLMDKYGFQEDSYQFDSYNSYMSYYLGKVKTAVEQNYGEKYKVHLSFSQVHDLSETELPDFSDSFSIGYDFPYGKIEKAKSVSLVVDVSGESSSSNQTYNFILLKEGEDWFVHPQYFQFSF